MRSRFEARLVNSVFGDPGLYVDFRDARRALLFDLGDNAALSSRHVLRVTHAFVSHTHMDHFVGFDRLLRAFVRRPAALHCFGPPGFVARAAHKLAAYEWNLVSENAAEFVLTATEVDAEGRTQSARFSTARAFAREELEPGLAANGVLLDEPGFRVRCVLLDHRTPCLGFALEESARVAVWKTGLAELGLHPGPWLAQAKQALLAGAGDEHVVHARWREGEGWAERTLSLGELRRAALRRLPEAKLAYVTDVAHHAENVRRIVALARGADPLFLESVFLDEDAEHGRRKQHLTARQAGEIARACGAGSLVPFHFSPRYREREDDLRAEAERAFRGDRE